MNNVELEEKVLEIIKEDNYFEMVTKAIAFEKEYKTSEFYKLTKRPLIDVIKEAKIYYALQLKDLTRHIQNAINGLSLEKINQMLDQMGDMFGQENEEIRRNLEVFKDLKS